MAGNSLWFLCLGVVLLQVDYLHAQGPCSTMVVYGQNTYLCKYMNLTAIPQDMQQKVQNLQFSGNPLADHNLQKDSFLRYPLLQKLYIDKCAIKTIETDAFRSLENLRSLILANNELDVIPSEAFRHTENLAILDLSGNKIKIITADAFIHLPKLENLQLHSNHIERIHPRVFVHTKPLTEINISKNKLNTLSRTMEKHLPRGLTVFRLYENRWRCDCNIRWVISYLTEKKISWKFSYDPVSCSAPSSIKNIDWKDLQPEQFACPAKVHVGNTSVAFQLGRNVSVICRAEGDPEPKITWSKGVKSLQAVSDGGRRRFHTKPSDGKLKESVMTIINAKASDAGDYKCMAQNEGGTSEVTYKLWEFKPQKNLPVTEPKEGGLNMEVVIGIAVGGGLVLLIVIAIVICYCRYMDRRNHEYRVRDYRKNTKDNRNNHIVDNRYDRNGPNVTTELLAEKDRDKARPPTTNHIIRQNGNGQTKNIEKQKLIQDSEKQKLLNDTHEKEKEINGRDNSVKAQPPPVKDPVKKEIPDVPPPPPPPVATIPRTEDEENAHEFKMKIFVHDKKNGAEPERQGHIPLHSPRDKPSPVGNCVRGGTPDLLQNSHTKHHSATLDHPSKRHSSSKKSGSMDNLLGALKEGSVVQGRHLDPDPATIRSPGAKPRPCNSGDNQLKGSHSLNCDMSKVAVPRERHSELVYKTLPNPKTGAKPSSQSTHHGTQPRKSSGRSSNKNQQVRFQTLPPKHSSSPHYAPAAVVGLDDLYPPKNKPGVSVQNLYGGRYSPAHYNPNPAITGSLDHTFTPTRRSEILLGRKTSPVEEEVEPMPEIGHQDEFGTVV